MKTKILEHVRNVCGLKNSDDIYGLFDLPVHLEHLLWCIETKHYGVSINSFGDFICLKSDMTYENMGVTYDLQKTVEQNLEDPALCKLLVEVLNIK